MATKIRLARHGRKRKAFYHIVVADSRAPRNGKKIERIGSYDPNTNPATIILDLEKAVSWMEKGAQATDTANAILSHQGALLKVHLNKGVKKGALTQEQAEEKFATWRTEKETKTGAKIDSIGIAKAEKAKASLEAETAKKEAIQQKIDARLAPEVEAVSEEVVDSAETTEEAVAEVTEVVETAETPEVVAETEVVTETEVVAETEAVKETEVVAETEVAKPEAPAAEESTEETKTEEA